VEAYNAKMEAQEVDAALRLELFRQGATPRIDTEVKELAEALSSREAFGEALRQICGNVPARSSGGVLGVRATLFSAAGAGMETGGGGQRPVVR
jgi:hypothetical protein